MMQGSGCTKYADMMYGLGPAGACWESRGWVAHSICSENPRCNFQRVSATGLPNPLC